MHERIADFLEHDLVEFRVLAVQPQLDFLAELAREFMHQAGKPVE